MYDIMLIDDDKAIRSHLKSMIAFERLPVRLVCEAGDSETAGEFFQIYRPKIVITDINIPIRSGLELAHEWQKIDPEIRFIVITGYSDIAYARDAVSLGAVELLLKPLQAEDVNKSLEKAIAFFEEARAKQLETLSMESLLVENLSILQRQYAALLLNPSVTKNADAIRSRLSLLEINLSGSLFAVIYASIYSSGTVPDDIEVLLYQVKTICDELLAANGYCCYSFLDDALVLRCIVSWDPGNEESELEACVGKLYEKVSFLLSTEISAGIGVAVERLIDLPLSAAQAQVALESRQISDYDSVVSFQNLKDVPCPVNSEQALSQLRQLLHEDNYEELADVMAATFDSYHEESQLETAREFSIRYASALLADMAGRKLTTEYLQEYSDSLARVLNADNVPVLRTCLINLTRSLMELISQAHADMKNELISSAQQFIVDNIGKRDMSLKMVGSFLGLSEVYFCRLFRKETGMSFTEFRNSERIKAAKIKLADIDKRVSEISDDVGYDNPKYFNYVFKRLVGLTPLEYRRSLRLE